MALTGVTNAHILTKHWGTVGRGAVPVIHSFEFHPSPITRDTSIS